MNTSLSGIYFKGQTTIEFCQSTPCRCRYPETPVKRRSSDGILFLDRLPTMEYTLTEHAIKRCRKRKIQIEWIAAALAHPARTENDKDDPTLVHALLAIPEKGFRVLRVIYNETVDPVAVVTVYFDDEATDL